VAYRTAELRENHPDRDFGKQERAVWEDDSAWQGFRELMESTLITWDWAEQFVALNLVAKPAIDTAVLRSLSVVAQAEGDTLLALLARAQLIDSDRTKLWSEALLAYAFDSAEYGELNRATVRGWFDKWALLGDVAVEAYCRALVPDLDHTVLTKELAEHRELLLQQTPVAK
jgi:toluene monooxygenase system protein E